MRPSGTCICHHQIHVVIGIYVFYVIETGIAFDPPPQNAGIYGGYIFFIKVYFQLAQKTFLKHLQTVSRFAIET